MLKSFKIFFSFLFFSYATILDASTRIMPLGDSITWGYPSSSGYRGYLWNKLQVGNFDVNFVGSKYDGSGFDGNHEGYGGYKTYEIGEIVYGLLQDNYAPIILLHIGTNDVSGYHANGPSTSISGLRGILNEIDRYESNYNRAIIVVLASIVRTSDNDPNVATYNSNLRSLAYSRINNGDKIVLVNMDSINSSDFVDRVHPNSTGYAKMANVWYNKLKVLLSPSTPFKPTNTSSSSVSHDSAKLNWNDASNNENGFNIYRGSTYITTVGAGVTSYTLSNLNSQTTYTYSVKAFNSQGSSSAAYITFTTDPEPIPSKPTNANVLDIDSYTVRLQWSDNSDNEQGFEIRKGNTHIATVGSNTTSYTLTHLESRETYSYNIRAYNQSGNSSSTEVTFVTEDDYSWLVPVNHVILF